MRDFAGAVVVRSSHIHLDHLILTLRSTNQLVVENLTNHQMGDELSEEVLPIWPRGANSIENRRGKWQIEFAGTPWSCSGLDAIMWDYGFIIGDCPLLTSYSALRQGCQDDLPALSRARSPGACCVGYATCARADMASRAIRTSQPSTLATQYVFIETRRRAQLLSITSSGSHHRWCSSTRLRTTKH